MKALLGALAVLVALCVGLGFVVAHEVKQNTSLTKANSDLSDKLTIADAEQKKLQASCFVTDKVVSDYTVKVEGLDATALNINTQLDKSLAEVLKQTQAKTDETDKTIKSVNYRTNAVLSDSMWNAYCSVQPTDSDCTSRQLTH